MFSNLNSYTAILALLGLSAFFSASETAFASANKTRLKKAAEEGTPGGRWANAVVERFDRALCSILLGNNLVNIGASAIASLLAVAWLGEKGAAVATFVMAMLILTFGEILPKQLAKAHAEAFALALALPVRFLTVVTAPIVTVVMGLVSGISRLWGGKEQDAALTEDELVTIIETVEDEGVIDEDRSDLLQSAIEFSEIEAQEIATHRVDLLAVDVNDSIDDIKATLHSAFFSRIPVYDGTIDKIIGILPVNAFYKRLLDQAEPNVRDLLTEACFVYKTLKLPAVFSEMQKRKQHMAIVIDEFGGTHGALTMEDILEELVGDIWDEKDEIVSEFVQVGENQFEVDGRMSLWDFFEQLDMDSDAPDTEYTTVGGWAIEVLERYPAVGDHFDFEDISVTVVETDELSVQKLLVMRSPGQSKNRAERR